MPRWCALGVVVQPRLLDAAFAEGSWLESALARPVLHRFETGDLTTEAAARLVDRMQTQQTTAQFFSVLPIRQAAPGSLQRCCEANVSTLTESRG
jgi:hypothetical protein